MADHENIFPNFTFVVAENVPLTKDEQLHNSKRTAQVLNQCANLDPSVTNQVVYGTSWCKTIAELLDDGENVKCSKNEIINWTSDHIVVWPWTAGYDNARLINNKLWQKFPIVISYVRSLDEIKRTIEFSKIIGGHISVRSGGNCFLNFSIQNQIIIDSTFLYDQTNFEEFADFIDFDRSTVLIPAGMRLGTLYTHLSKYGYVIAGGICPTVAAGGLISGGGIGYLIRKYGYSVDQAIEFELVLPNKKTTYASRKENFDLYKACRGAGGNNFGVITSIKLNIFPIRKVVFFQYFFNLNDLAEVNRALELASQTAPSSLASLIISFGSNIPALVVDGMYPILDCKCGKGKTDKNAKDNLKHILQTHFLSHLPSSVKPISQTMEIMSFVEAEKEVANFALLPTLIPFNRAMSRFYSQPLPAYSLNALVKIMKQDIPDGVLLAVQNVAFGGRANENFHDTVMPAREGTLAWLSLVVLWNEQEQYEKANEFLERAYSTLATHLAVPNKNTYAYINYPEQHLDKPLESYYGDYVPFLHNMKKLYDPDGLFNFSQGIK
jgi:FAD/FMN-containing dehydrogenase